MTHQAADEGIAAQGMMRHQPDVDGSGNGDTLDPLHAGQACADKTGQHAQSGAGRDRSASAVSVLKRSGTAAARAPPDRVSRPPP